MQFNTRSNLVGTHAFLSPSSPAWVNYEEDKLDRVFFAAQAARRGIEFHAFAHDAIRLRIKLPDLRSTINMYVNDAIGYGMTPEQILYYSDNCYGHADCVGFRNNTLRIHDLKTGVNEVSMAQLRVYAALFCLESLQAERDSDRTSHLPKQQRETRDTRTRRHLSGHGSNSDLR